MIVTDSEIIRLIDTSLAEEFELDQATLTPDAHIYEDLGLDSLDMVDMVVVLEKAFHFKIREEEAIREIRTLGDIHEFVLSKKREMGA
jgi:acyl carrier protein